MFFHVQISLYDFSFDPSLKYKNLKLTIKIVLKNTLQLSITFWSVKNFSSAIYIWIFIQIFNKFINIRKFILFIQWINFAKFISYIYKLGTVFFFFNKMQDVFFQNNTFTRNIFIYFCSTILWNWLFFISLRIAFFDFIHFWFYMLLMVNLKPFRAFWVVFRF